MTTFCDIAQARDGATPGTFGGGMTIQMSHEARKLLGLIISNSFSAYTTDEGGTLLMQYALSSGLISGNQYLVAGLPWNSGPATNHATWTRPQDIVPLDIDLRGNEILSLDVSNSGGTQTGTLDGTFGAQYANGQLPPSDWMIKYPNPVHFKGSAMNFNSAITATTESLLQSHKSTGNNTIPSIARELVACRGVMAADTAVTAAEEHTGHFRIDGTIPNLGKQKFPSNSLDPGAGTEVEGGAGHMVPWIPIHIPLPATDVTLQYYYQLYGASTGGVTVAFCTPWR